MESLTALVEHADGRLEILDYSKRTQHKVVVPPKPRPHAEPVAAAVEAEPAAMA